MAQGKKYFDSGEFEKARITYLAVLRLDPQNQEAIKQLGLVALEQGANFEAIRYLKKASSSVPKDLALRKKLAEAFLGLQFGAEARAEANAILILNPEYYDAFPILVETAGTEEELKELDKYLQKASAENTSVLIVQAGVALKRNDVKLAEASLEKALARDPKSSAVHSAMSALESMKGDMARAEEELKTAAALTPRSGANLAYAQLLYQKDPKAAEAYLNQQLEKSGDYIPLLILRARLAASQKETDKAAAYLDRVFLIDGTNFEGRVMQGQILLRKGESDKAIDLFKKISESPVYGRMAAPKYELARAYLQKSNPSQALASLSEAVKIQPDHTEAILLLAQIKLQQGDPQSVVDSMRGLLDRKPNFLPAQLLLSQAYRSQGNLVEAKRVLEGQLKATPSAAEPHLLLGLIFLQEGKRAEARETFEVVRKLDRKNLLAVYHLTELDLAEKKFEQAAQRAKELSNELTNVPGPWYILARVFVAQERWDEAEAALKKSIDYDINFLAAYELLVSMYVQNHKLEEARAQTESLVGRNPDNIGALLALAMIQENMRDFEKARETYLKVVAGNPNAAIALNNLALIYADNFNQLDKAFEFASRARTLQPENGAIADTLGWIAYRRQDYQQAQGLLQEAAEKRPENIEVQYHYGMASYMVGKTDVARTVLSKVAMAPGDFSGKAEVSRTLALLEENGAGKEMSVAELEAILKQQPNDIVVRQRLADQHEANGDFAKSAGLWEEALKLNPKLLAGTLRLARLYAGRLQDPAKAFDYAKKARSLAPNDLEVSRLAGQAAFQTGNFSWAYSLLQDAARQPGADTGMLRDLAWTAYHLGKIEEARQAMQRILSQDEKMTTAEDRQFLELTAIEDKPEEAVKVESRVQTILQRDPAYVPAQMLKAASNVQQKRPAEAIKTYQAILGRLPDFALAQKRLAALYIDRPEQSEAAFDLATKARKSLPQDPEVAQLLAAIRYHRKEYASVLQLLTESAAKRSLNAKCLFYEGMSRIQLKQTEDGRASLSKALDSGLDGSAADEARRELAKSDAKP